MRFLKALVVVPSLAGVLSAGTPASALVQPSMNLSITAYSTYHRVCGSGTADPTLFVAGQWVLAVHGSRSDGTAINQVVSVPGRTSNACMNVLKFGAAQGEYQASLSYVGAGLDVVGERVGYGAWQPSVLGVGDTVVVPVQGI